MCCPTLYSWLLCIILGIDTKIPFLYLEKVFWLISCSTPKINTYFFRKSKNFWTLQCINSVFKSSAKGRYFSIFILLIYFWTLIVECLPCSTNFFLYSYNLWLTQLLKKVNDKVKSRESRVSAAKFPAVIHFFFPFSISYLSCVRNTGGSESYPWSIWEKESAKELFPPGSTRRACAGVYRWSTRPAVDLIHWVALHSPKLLLGFTIHGF